MRAAELRRIRRRVALEELTAAAKRLDPVLIEALVVVAIQLGKSEPAPKRTGDAARLRAGIGEAMRWLGSVDPEISAIAARMVAEAEALGATEARH